MLHLAIKTGNLKFVKLLFMKEFNQSLLDTPMSDDIFGNLRESTVKLLQVTNNKNMTPLMVSIE